MHKISIPVISNEKLDTEGVLKALQRAEAEYVFLALDMASYKKENRQKKLDILKPQIEFFKEKNYKVGVWLWSLWMTDLPEDKIRELVMADINGKLRVSDNPLNSNEKISSGFICPTSKEGVEVMSDYIGEIAKLGPDIILFDDDLGYGTYLNSIGCYCDRHVKEISQRLGYEISREELSEKVACGKPNEIREKWYELIGATLEGYAKKIRGTINKVDPKIRCGLCSVMSNWCSDGTTAEKLVKLLAGDTKPFMRLIGAPYWAPWDHRLQYIIELERMESSWVKDENIEIFSEGDTFPRPRHQVPARYLEIFDTALRAVGATEGCHKYMMDYTSKPDYEKGYLDRHVKNKPLYEDIERIFSDKTAVGVRVYEELEKIPQADFTGIEKPHKYATNLFFSDALKLLCLNGIPTTFKGRDGVGIAFGENARYLPDEALDKGLIIDIRAAKILMEKGVDVGIESVGGNIVNNLVYFPKYDDYVVTSYKNVSAYELSLKKGAEVVVYGDTNGKRNVDAFCYENAKGQRFLVYAFDGAFTRITRYLNYYTQLQLFDAVEWLGKKKMAVKCKGNPDLYLITKENDEALAIGLWNIFADEIEKPVIELGREYSSAEFINCDGELKADRIELSRIEPFGFAFVHLKK